MQARGLESFVALSRAVTAPVITLYFAVAAAAAAARRKDNEAGQDEACQAEGEEEEPAEEDEEDHGEDVASEQDGERGTYKDLRLMESM